MISDGCDPLDLRVTVDPHVEKQAAAAPGGYLGGFFSEAQRERADAFDCHL
ncbi:hypothetical protein X726_32780 [Mesorhizobium sp. L103C105A0]|nr:hypothetical protein X726_32780 [Mesorhizobium sp. L103C105A0]